MGFVVSSRKCFHFNYSYQTIYRPVIAAKTVFITRGERVALLLCVNCTCFKSRLPTPCASWRPSLFYVWMLPRKAMTALSRTYVNPFTLIIQFFDGIQFKQLLSLNKRPSISLVQTFTVAAHGRPLATQLKAPDVNWNVAESGVQ